METREPSWYENPILVENKEPISTWGGTPSLHSVVNLNSPLYKKSFFNLISF